MKKLKVYMALTVLWLSLFLSFCIGIISISLAADLFEYHDEIPPVITHPSEPPKTYLLGNDPVARSKADMELYIEAFYRGDAYTVKQFIRKQIVFWLKPDLRVYIVGNTVYETSVPGIKLIKIRKVGGTLPVWTIRQGVRLEEDEREDPSDYIINRAFER